MVDITDTDYMHAKRISKDFEVKNLCQYHYLYLKSDTFLLANVFKNFRNICLKIYHLYPVKTSFNFSISMARSFNKDWSKIRTINWYWYAITGWKGIRGLMCHGIH